jgi:hypothetical protein
MLQAITTTPNIQSHDRCWAKCSDRREEELRVNRFISGPPNLTNNGVRIAFVLLRVGIISCDLATMSIEKLGCGGNSVMWDFGAILAYVPSMTNKTIAGLTGTDFGVYYERLCFLSF